MTTRRHLLTSMTAVAAATALPPRPGRPASAGAGRADPGAIRLGDRRSAFDDAFGRGRPLDSGLIEYGSPGDGEVIYAVRFLDDVAELVEVDLRGVEGGAVPEPDADVGRSRFLPDDADLLVRFRGGDIGAAASYDLALHASATLADATDRSGLILVLDQEQTPADGPNDTLGYVAASVAMETYDRVEIVPGGGDVAIGDTFDDWDAAYGPVSGAQRFMVFENSPIGSLQANGYAVSPGSSEVNTGERPVAQIVVGFSGDGRWAASDAYAEIGGLLPADAQLDATFLTQPTARGDTRPAIRRRVQVWTLPSLDLRVAVFLDVEGDEETGSVRQAVLLLEDPDAQG